MTSGIAHSFSMPQGCLDTFPGLGARGSRVTSPGGLEFAASNWRCTGDYAERRGGRPEGVARRSPWRPSPRVRVRSSTAFACSHSACVFATDGRPWREEAPGSSVLIDDPRRVELPQLFYLERYGPQHQERRDLSACSRTSAADWRIHDGRDHGRAARATGARTAQARCSGSRSKTPCDRRAMCESHGTGASFAGARRHAL